jgi:hypothetical protein
MKVNQALEDQPCSLYKGFTFLTIIHDPPTILPTTPYFSLNWTLQNLVPQASILK